MRLKPRQSEICVPGDGCSVAKIRLLYCEIEEAMTVTLKLKPEVEAGLLEQARAKRNDAAGVFAFRGGRGGAFEGAGECLGRRACSSV
jgi:hypothetical protein